MKYYTFLIAMKDENNRHSPFEVAALSLSDAIKFLERDTGLSFSYEINPQ